MLPKYLSAASSYAPVSHPAIETSSVSTLPSEARFLDHCPNASDRPRSAASVTLLFPSRAKIRADSSRVENVGSEALCRLLGTMRPLARSIANQEALNAADKILSL